MEFAEEIADFLQELLRAHGVAASRHKEWSLPEGRRPAMRGIWHSGDGPRTAGRLDIQVALEDGRVIVEGFAGVGEGIEGARDGLKNFTTNSFHVLLAALWDRVDEERVTVETWRLSSGNATAYIGPFGTRGSPEPVRDLLPEAFGAIEAALKGAQLGPEMHWARSFYCHLRTGETTVEAMLDNRDWPAGREAFAAVAWPGSEDWYMVRNFLVLSDVA